MTAGESGYVEKTPDCAIQPAAAGIRFNHSTIVAQRPAASRIGTCGGTLTANPQLDTARDVARNPCIMSGITSVLSSSALWRRLGLKRHNWPGRFTILLVANLVLLVSQPML
jgi:hypothetical protein